jgi:hypothetical protein
MTQSDTAAHPHPGVLFLLDASGQCKRLALILLRLKSPRQPLIITNVITIPLVHARGPEQEWVAHQNSSDTK